MISDEVKNKISDWAKERDSNDAYTLTLLAIAYIEENHIDWNTPSGKAQIISHVETLSYGKTHKVDSYIDGWLDHQPENKTFEISLDEVFTSDLEDDIEKNISPLEENKPFVSKIHTEEPYSDNIKIELLPFPFEIKELLRELDNKAYKSPYLANFTAQGRMKLIRKAKILAFLYKSKKIK